MQKGKIPKKRFVHFDYDYRKIDPIDVWLTKEQILLESSKNSAKMKEYKNILEKDHLLKRSLKNALYP